MSNECDVCGGSEYTADNPKVRYCVPRPSDKRDLCCTMWGHWRCLGHETEPYAAHLPTENSQYALATYTDLETWIETPAARKLGYLFIT